MGKRITNNEIDRRLLDLVGDTYVRVSDYVKGTVKIQLRHKTCGSIYEVTPNHFFQDGRRCRCQINIKQPETFASEFKKEARGEYTQLSVYERNTKKIQIRHEKCSRCFYMTPKDFLRGNRCPLCARNKKKTTAEFKKEVETKGQGNYKLMSDYTRNTNKVCILHKECNRTYEVTPKDFLRGNRCPFCKQSKGEQLVASILDLIGVTYEIQKTFETLKNGNSKLPFDFFLPKENILIEYDGIQHFKPVAYFGGEYKLTNQVRRDNLKNIFARDNGITLVRVNYQMSYDEIYNTIISYCSKAETLSDRV